MQGEERNGDVMFEMGEWRRACVCSYTAKQINGLVIKIILFFNLVIKNKIC